MKELPTNLRRLVYFHHRSAREFAETLGTTERAVSAWLNGKREPSYKTVTALAHVYGVDPVTLDGDPYKFAARLADPDRIEATEKAISSTKRDRLKAV